MAKWDSTDDIYSGTPLAERQEFALAMAEREEQGRRDRRFQAEIDEIMAEYEAQNEQRPAGGDQTGR